MLILFRVTRPVRRKSSLCIDSAVKRNLPVSSKLYSVQPKVLSTMKAPIAPQDVSEVTDLVSRLNGSSNKAGGGRHSLRCRKHTYDIEGTDIAVDSWQYRDWDYKRRDLPTYARGLFTYRKRNGKPEIAARGYDKFFNVGEVHETGWPNVEVRP